MKNVMIAASLLCLLAGLPGSVPETAQAKDYNLGNIMPLGDSITMGWPVEGGYRDPLYNRLHAAGYAFSLVGSSTENPTTTLASVGQINHEGHGGYFIRGDLDPPPVVGGTTYSGLYENLGDWIGPDKADPDVILLMVGTNDIYCDYQRATAPDRLSALINRIYECRSSVSLFVASITPMRDSVKDAYAQTYNAAIPSILAGQRELGRDVHFVDMHSKVASSDLYTDGVHLAATGCDKMAEAWAGALMTLAPEPGMSTLATTGLLALLAYAWQKRPLGKAKSRVPLAEQNGNRPHCEI